VGGGGEKNADKWQRGPKKKYKKKPTGENKVSITPNPVIREKKKAERDEEKTAGGSGSSSRLTSWSSEEERGK